MRLTLDWLLAHGVPETVQGWQVANLRTEAATVLGEIAATVSRSVFVSVVRMFQYGYFLGRLETMTVFDERLKQLSIFHEDMRAAFGFRQPIPFPAVSAGDAA